MERTPSSTQWNAASPSAVTRDGPTVSQRDGHDRIGLATVPARDFDGVTWQIREDPVIDVGQPGAWDEGAIWFTTVEKIDGIYYL